MNGNSLNEPSTSFLPCHRRLRPAASRSIYVDCIIITIHSLVVQLLRTINILILLELVAVGTAAQLHTRADIGWSGHHTPLSSVVLHGFGNLITCCRTSTATESVFLRHGRWKNICSAEPVSSGPKPINRADLIIHLSNLQQVYAIIVSMVGCLPHHTHPQKFCVFLSDFKNRFRLLENLTGRVQWTIHEYLKKCLWSVTGHWQKRKVAVRWHELSISIYASAVHKTATAHHAIARLFTMY